MDLLSSREERSFGGSFRLCLFSDQEIGQRCPNARSEMRSKSRGVMLLSSLIRDLARETPLDPHTGCYLTFAAGPVHAATQDLLNQVGDDQRVGVLEKSLPPKDYFIANPAMKAAQIAIEFQLHGPWMCFPAPQTGLEHCIRYASLDLRDQQIPAALVGGFFGLDDTSELSDFASATLSECAYVQYVLSPEELLPSGLATGKYGPFTSIIRSLTQ